ncbi:MAG TPA: hypothetical protein VII16_14725, partial [Actinomycetes bacterium]
PAGGSARSTSVSSVDALRGTDLPTWLILAANRLVMQRLPELPSTHGWVADEGLVLIQPRRAPTNTSPFFQSPSRMSGALGAARTST